MTANKIDKGFAQRFKIRLAQGKSRTSDHPFLSLGNDLRYDIEG